MTAVAGDVDRRDSTSIRRSHLATLGQHLAAIGCLAFLVRLLASGWDAGYAPYFPDSSSFAAVAERGPLTGRFWFDERPVGFPLLFWLCGQSARLLVFVQSALYLVAFVSLAGAAARSLRTWPARILAVVVVAGIGVQPRFALWNTHVLSESLGISVGVGMLAAWWWLVVRPSTDRAWLAVATSAAWLVIRDSHVLPLVLVAVPAMLVASWRWLAASAEVRRVLRLGAVLVLALATYVTTSQAAADRNIYPVINNIGQRILPDEDMREWFVDRGLPLDDNLLTHTGRNSFDDDSALLEDPSLEEFRQWAATSGQRWELVSFVVRAPFWLGELGDQLDALLSEDYADYDGFDVGPHLSTAPGMLAGPRSAAALAVGLVLAAVGLAVAFTDRRLRTRAAVVGLFLAGALVDSYLSFAGDSLEVGRHVVGPMSRVSISLGLAYVLGVESLARRHRRLVASGVDDDDDDDDDDLEADRRSVRVRPAALVTSALIALVGAAALFANELRSQDYDPLYMKVLVDRANSLGLTYYESGLHNKGPLEPFVYQVASWITSDDGYWFAISLFVILTALVVGVAVGLTARTIGVSRRGGYAVGAAVVVHLVLSRSDYAGVLYSRNMVVALFAAVWSVSLYAPFWQGRRRSTTSALVIGALIGLAVQTLPASALSAAVVAVFALVQMRIRVAGAWRHHAALLTGTLVLVIGLAPTWYALRGRFDEFWGGWWIYARYQSEGLGRSVPRQFGRAWDEAYAYYIDRPALVLLLAAFVVFTLVRWRRIRVAQRVLRVLLLGWILAAWVELALGQRYSTHYFIVLAVPTALVVAVVIADTWVVLRRSALIVPPRAGEWLVAAAIVVSVIAGGATELRKGFVGAGEFRGVPAFATARRNHEQGPVRSMRAALDIISDDGDPLLAWTDKPWTYLQWDRVAATRYIWSTFLTGQIYLGRAGPEFVPPHTAEWFADDIAETNPVTYLQDAGQPPLVPLVADLIAADFVVVYDAPAHDLFARHEVAEQLITPADVDVPWRPEELAAGWTAGSGDLSSPSGGSAADQVMLAGSCRRLDGFLDPASTAEVRFVIDDRTSTGETQVLGIAGDSAWSATEAVELERTEWVSDGDDAEQRRPFSVVVGDRSAVLIVDGMIRAAVRTRGDVSLAVRATDQPIELTGLRVTAADFVPGC